MSTRKTTLFYASLISLASLAVGMVLASRLDLTSQSQAQALTVASSKSAPLTGPLDTQTFRTIAKNVTPSVVNIRTESKRPLEQTPFGGDELFRRFFGGPDEQQPRRPREQVAVAAGSGFIISKDGFILTNNHVVEDATKIEVFLFEEEQDAGLLAKVIGRDPLTDSALLQLVDKPGHAIQEITFGDSSQVQSGDWVMAIGNPFGLAHTVSVGVISASRRSAFPVAEQRRQDVLQTDAAINPGNSGGPLLNLRGEVIGINTAIYSDQARSGNIGIGFAIPINLVRDLLPQLRTGKVTRGRIAISVQSVPREALEELGLKKRAGALVATVAPDGPSAKAGMRPGDVILEYNGKAVSSSDDLVRMVVDTKPGSTVPVKILRDKQERTLQVTVEELDLTTEGNRASRGPSREQEENVSEGFGMTLGSLTSEIARRLRVPSGQTGAVVTDVDPSGASARAGLREDDVILQVNRRAVSSASEASRALQAVASGRIAQLLIWRQGQEVFVTVRKD
jgi:serine protease Do